MIDTVETRRLWAQSLSEDFSSRTLTYLVPTQGQQPTVTAHIDLARVEGGGFAKAFIFSYEQLHPFTAGPVTTPLEPPLSKGDPRVLTSAPSSITIPYAYSITFGLSVRNMFAYANCVILIHQSSLLRELLTVPDRIFGP